MHMQERNTTHNIGWRYASANQKQVEMSPNNSTFTSSPTEIAAFINMHNS